MKTVSLFALTVALATSSPILYDHDQYQLEQYLLNPAIQRLREYIQIDTSKQENIRHAVEFWRKQALEADLEFAVYEPLGLPICVLTWRGADPSLPSIMLNSHMDVVGVEPDAWLYPPFAAYMDANGDIYGRGTQDTKDVGVQYLEAVRKLKQQGVILQRTIHITLMPDEESGGARGMVPFIDTDEFRAMNVGFALDEGLASADDSLYASYVDKRPWQMNFTVHGISGHGGLGTTVSAMEKLRSLIEAISNYRNSQLEIENVDSYSYNSVNINMIQGGFATNVIPDKMSLVVDMRLSPFANIKEMQDIVDSWKDAAGNDTDVTFLRRIDKSLETPIDDYNYYWNAFINATTDMGLCIKPILCPATSDMIYLRNQGIPAIGFTTKSYTITRIHGANEYVNSQTFLNGIDIYATIIINLGDLL